MAKQKVKSNEPKKFTVWCSDIDYEDWRKDMEIEYPELDDEERYDKALEMNDTYLGDEHFNLRKVFEDKDVILIGQVYRWNGTTVPAYKDLDNTSSEEVLRNHGGEFCDIYVQRSNISGKSELIERFGGHDDPMCNTFMYVRVKKDGLSDKQNERLENIINDYVYEGKIGLKTALEELDTYTKSPAKDIAKVYGWKLERSPRKPKSRAVEQNRTTPVLEQ